MIGIAISYALVISERVYATLSWFADVENCMTSVERVVSYSRLEPEPGYQKEAEVPVDWPTHGSISFESVSFRYYPSGPTILKGKCLWLNFFRPKKKPQLSPLNTACNLVSALDRVDTHFLCYDLKSSSLMPPLVPSFNYSSIHASTNSSSHGSGHNRCTHPFPLNPFIHSFVR